MFWPCETRTSICRNLATISSGLYRFLAITVLLDVKDIPQVGPLQWGWIKIEKDSRPTLRRSTRRGPAAAMRQCRSDPSVAKAGVPCGGARPLLVPRQERSLCQPDLSDKR